MRRNSKQAVGAVLVALAICLHGAASGAGRANVREHGARGDGVTLDTAAIQAAVDAAASDGGGQVVFPPGRFLSGTIHLRSRVTLQFEAGARLIGTTNLDAYHQPVVPVALPEARWGKWHRALLLGEKLEDVTLCGPGVIDGNRVFDPTGEEQMRGPHALVLVDCRRVNVRDLTFEDAANYALLALVTDELDVRNVTFIGGWDGLHWRGAPYRWCRNVRVTGCRFFTGDDALAGRYWENTLISDCLINSSCNGLRLIGPALRLTVAHNLFRGPGERPHLTSRARQRTNMLSGIILQPGAWDRTTGPLDEVVLIQNSMVHVASPVTIWTKPSNPVGRVLVQGLQASGVYRAALSAESWSDQPMREIVFRDMTVEFTGGGAAADARRDVSPPGVDARPLPAWGLYARRVARLVLEDLRLALAQDDFRPAIFADSVGTLRLEDVRYPAVEGVTAGLVTTNVGTVIHLPQRTPGQGNSR